MQKVLYSTSPGVVLVATVGVEVLVIVVVLVVSTGVASVVLVSAVVVDWLGIGVDAVNV